MFRERSNDQVTEQFMREVQMKQISSNEKSFLEGPITIVELEEALKRMSKNKSHINIKIQCHNVINVIKIKHIRFQ